MLRGEHPTIFGDGEQSRDFTFVANVVDANLRCCTAPAAQVAGLAFNAATGRRVTLNQTFSLLQKLTGYNGHPHFAPERTGDIKHSVADISRIDRAIGYKPTVMFEEGLRHTVDWYRTQETAAMR